MNGILAWLGHNEWLYLGSLSGSLVAMLVPRDLDLRGRLQSLVIGSLFGFFVGPAIVETWFKKYDPAVSSIPSFVTFGTGLVAVAIIPAILSKAKEFVAKYQIRIVPVEPPHD